jgi:hypothetical protein
LGQVIGELLEIPEPHAAVLPVDVTGGAHETTLLLCGACRAGPRGSSIMAL